MINSQVFSPPNQLLSNDRIIETLHEGLDGKFQSQEEDNFG